MEKHIGKFADVAALSAAVIQNAISRPFVALTEDNDKVVYGPKLDLAKVGDIAVYGVAEDQIYYIKQANYNTTDFPTADYVPIGVVCKDQDYNVQLEECEPVQVMNLRWLNPSSPEEGSLSRVIFGCARVVASSHPHRVGSPQTDFDGKRYSEFYWDFTSEPLDWRTANSLSGSESDSRGMPFVLAWRWKTPGTSNGDWYIPAVGEIVSIALDENKRSVLNNSFTMLGSSTFDTAGFSYGQGFITSSAWSYGNGYLFAIINYSIGSNSSYSNSAARAITSLTITELKK